MALFTPVATKLAEFNMDRLATRFVAGAILQGYRVIKVLKVFSKDFLGKSIAKINTNSLCEFIFIRNPIEIIKYKKLLVIVI